MLSLRARRTLVWKRMKHNWSVTRICSHFRINRDTFYYHWDNYKQHGWNGLAIKSKRPHVIHSTPDSLVNKVVMLRKLTRVNEKAIAAALRRKGISIAHGTVYNILDRKGLISHLDKPRKQRSYIRFQRKHPNSLWQADLTIFGNRYAIAFIDDCSRFVTGMDFIPKASLNSVLSIFNEALGNYGKPRQILTDHGAHFYSVRKGESLFDQFCMENGIEHILGGIGKPTTTGKIERFFQTFKKEFVFFNSMEDYLKYYNYKRLHGSLDYLTPAEIYFNKK